MVIHIEPTVFKQAFVWLEDVLNHYINTKTWIGIYSKHDFGTNSIEGQHSPVKVNREKNPEN